MKIVLIGAGNVGYHLGKKLHQEGFNIIQVFSRQRDKAKKVAELIEAEAITELSLISKKADLYILAVHDDAIKNISKTMVENGLKDKLIVHTSGATPMSVFNQTGINRFGVFYPLQTFSILKEPNFNEIPFCIDANNQGSLKELIALAKKCSSKVYVINDKERAVLHVAAVFVNNFTNHLYKIAYEILRNENLEFEILMPLIEETVNKIKNNNPSDMQTGPAIRGDEETIKKHLQYLKSNPDCQKIYKMLTASIQLKAI